MGSFCSAVRPGKSPELAVPRFSGLKYGHLTIHMGVSYPPSLASAREKETMMQVEL